MGIVIRRSGFNALLSYLGFFIGYVNMLWLFPFVFQPEEIGLIRILLAVAALFSTLFSFGGSQIAVKFFPYFSGTIQRRAAFLRFLCVLAFAGVLLLFIGFLCFQNTIRDIYSPKAPLLVSFLWYLVPLASSLIMCGILEGYIIVQEHPIVPTLIREVYTRGLLMGTSLLFLAAWISFSVFIGIVTLLYCFAPIILYFYGTSKGLIPRHGFIEQIQKKELRDIYQFGLFAFIGNTGAALLANMDSILLSAYSGLSSTGIYGIAMFIAVIIEVPKRALSQVLIPLVVKANKDQDRAVLSILYKKSSLNQFIIGSMIFLLVWLNIDGIFSLIPHGEVYREGKWVVFWIGLAKLFDMLTGINSEIIGTSQYYRMDLFFFSIVSVIGIVLNVFLIPLYGILGAALAVFIATVLYNTIRFAFIAGAMKIQPFTKNTLVACMGFFCTYGILLCLPTIQGTFVNIGIRTLSIVIIYGGFVFGFHVSEDLSHTIKKIITRLR